MADEGTLLPPTSLLESVVASVTSSALEAIATAIESPPSPSTGSGTSDEDVPEGNYVINTLIGLVIVLGASVLNALGLNLTKLDHLQQQGIPKRQRKKEYLRGLWLAGMGIYVASQIFGSPLALRYLRPDWVAPLGASSLVFNFLFARWMVGTPVTTSDIRGTALIVFGVILIVVFSSINHGLKQELSVSELNTLWGRGSWIAYFIFLILFIFGTYVVADLFGRVTRSRASFSPLPSPTLGLGAGLPGSRPTPPSNPIVRAFRGAKAKWRVWDNFWLGHLERFLARTDDGRVLWFEGIGWAVAGGSLAGLCLVFTKAVVKIFWRPGHPLVHFTPLLTLVLLTITAVLQIICLNKALQCADTVVVVPLFYAGYTVFGFINSLIFYNQSGQYARWVLVAVFLSMGVLIGGVVLLSTKETSEDAGHTVTTSPPEPNLRLRPRDHTSADGTSSSVLPKEGQEAEATPAPAEEVLWEVGSVSEDGGDDDEHEQKGVGGTKGSKGERGGLLLDEDDDDDYGHAHRPSTTTLPEDDRDEEDETEQFGAFVTPNSNSRLP
ncbi:uncharacterized protein LOC62_06G007959 [Vanrija pseudolonga]|uniref:Uncharacterized protein n=1 Tax=Vanrija pseudolonga TaxID=143232 RepID=A0AAF0YGL1_9TREE|nr:hypothetical protein LOC62_06G007959 [Vanrija pseudolonga]